jgi:hypothetical protein
MNRMARGKRIIFFPGEGYAAEMAGHGLSVRPFLVKYPFQEVRQERGRDRRYQDMGACALKIRASVLAIQPPAGGQQAEHVLVSTPS